MDPPCLDHEYQLDLVERQFSSRLLERNISPFWAWVKLDELVGLILSKMQSAVHREISIAMRLDPCCNISKTGQVGIPADEAIIIPG